jgi:anti-sigma regulatory factor (Ser/Thr protein kinase)
MRDGLRRYLRDHKVPEGIAGDVVLCVHEAAMNGMRFGGGRVDVRVWLRNGRVVASVKDRGLGFSSQRPSLLDLTATGGRGLYVIRYLMDQVAIDCSKGTEVRMEKRLPTQCGGRLHKAGVPIAS